MAHRHLHPHIPGCMKVLCAQSSSITLSLFRTGQLLVAYVTVTLRGKQRHCKSTRQAFLRVGNYDPEQEAAHAAEVMQAGLPVLWRMSMGWV